MGPLIPDGSASTLSERHWTGSWARPCPASERPTLLPRFWCPAPSCTTSTSISPSHRVAAGHRPHQDRRLPVGVHQTAGQGLVLSGLSLEPVPRGWRLYRLVRSTWKQDHAHRRAFVFLPEWNEEHFCL